MKTDTPAGDQAGERSSRDRYLKSLPRMASHPTLARSRALIFGVVAAAPALILILCFLIILIWSFAEPEAGLRLLLQVGTVLRLLIPLLVFMGGFGAAGLLIIMASKAGIRFAGADASEGGSGVLAALVATAILGAMGLGLSLWSNDGRLEILGHILLVMPFVISVALLGIAVDRIEGRSNWRIFGLIPLVIFVLMYLSVLMGTGTRFLVEVVTDFFGPELLLQYPQLGDLDDLVRSSSLVLLFAAIAAYMVLRRPWSGDAGDEGREKEVHEAPKSFLSRIIDFFSNLFRSGKDDAGDHATAAPAAIDRVLFGEEPPSWMAGSAQKIEATEFFGRTETPAPKVDEGSFWRGMFGGRTPTIDQVAALEALLGRGDDIQVDQDRPGVMPDLLLQGHFGSGRSTLLTSAAVASVVLRGQYALIIVPDRRAASRLLKTIEDQLRWAQLDGLISATSIQGREDLVSARQDVDLPQILVGTVADVQALFFEGRIANQETRRLLEAIGVVMVEDLLDFDDEDRLELPFILQKIRMLQASVRHWVQFLVVIPVMDRMPAVRDHLARRLFSQVHPFETMTLRNWNRLPDEVRVVPVADSGHAEAVSEICSDLPSERVRVMVVSARAETNLDGIPRRDSVVTVRSHADLDAAVSVDPIDWLVIIEDGHRGSRQLAAKIDLVRIAKQTIWISLVSPGFRSDAQDLQLVPHQVPILGASTAQGRWIRHAMEVVPNLEPMSPIDRTDWIQFGLPGVGQIPRIADDDLVVPVFELELDPPDSVGGSITGVSMSGRRGMYHWASVRPGASKTASMLDSDREYRVAIRNGNQVVVVGGEEPSAGRRGYWLTEDGQAIGSENQVDFAIADELELHHGETAFAPVALRLDEVGRIRITGSPVEAGQSDRAYRYPIWEGRWSLPEHELGSEIALVSRAAPGLGTRRVNLDDAG